MVVIREMTGLIPAENADLAELLIRVVGDGASVGWLDPPTASEAEQYWLSTIRPGNILLCAFEGERVVGTGQLELAQRANGANRAEVNKVLVHPGRQGEGIGKLVMLELESTARRLGRTLLHLDTNQDDSTNTFYLKLGWTPIGSIPNWARSGPDKVLHGTTFYYKWLSE